MIYNPFSRPLLWLVAPLLLWVRSDTKAPDPSPLYLGTKTPYRPPRKAYTPPPAGYHPVFINYVGRHGARFFTKPEGDLLVFNLLSLTSKQDDLTDTGRQVLQMAGAFETIQKKGYKNITLSGDDEQTGIGSRLFRQYPSVFRGKGIEVSMTEKIRTQQSAHAFLKGLKNYPAEAVHTSIIPNASDDLLRFYDLSPAYQTYKHSTPVRKRLDSLYHDPQMTATAMRICKGLFKRGFVRQMAAGRIQVSAPKGKQRTITPVDFTQALYSVYAGQFSIKREMERVYPRRLSLHFERAFTIHDLKWLDFIKNAEDFFEKGPATDTLGIQIIIAAPLLANFINTTDSVITGKKTVDAELRFTHAEAISPFATLLGIPAASQPSSSVYHFQEHWKAANIIPMSANIQWIIYTNGKKYLLKVLLNEKEVSLPVGTHLFPYYDWEAVKAYYIQKLTRLHAGPGVNMMQFLKQVR